MKKSNNKLSSIIVAICEAVVGALLIINASTFTRGIITAVGIAIFVLGIIEIIKYFRLSPEEAAIMGGLAKGLILILGGVFCVFRSGWFIETFHALTILYGVGNLIVGAAKIDSCVGLLRLKRDGWLWSGISALVTVICAVVILFNPFGESGSLWIFTAVSFICQAALDFAAMIIPAVNKKTAEKS